MENRISRRASARLHENRGRPRRSFQPKVKRNLSIEPLENRVLLAVGPRLVGINSNDGSLLQDGETRNIAPQDLTFRFTDGQSIDAGSLDGIRIARAGDDGVLNTNDDVIIDPGFIGIGEMENEVIVRFVEALPDDNYVIDIRGEGGGALRNVQGDAFNDGRNVSVDFELDLGSQIVAVVPQPVTRNDAGELTQVEDTIIVYFNDDDLNPSSARDPSFYQLIFTNDTATNTDDIAIPPMRVNYNERTDVVELKFGAGVSQLATGPGTYRLRIGTQEVTPSPPARTQVSADPGSSFDTAHVVGVLGGEGRLISERIDPQQYRLEFPGDELEPGHRFVPAHTHLRSPADAEPGITTFPYNFKAAYGFDPAGNVLFNLITETQKQRSREIFELYGNYIGAQFIETDADGLTVATGDLRAVDPMAITGRGGLFGLSGLATDPATGLLAPTSIMDASEIWDDSFGKANDPNKVSWFETAMHEIGHLLGLGHTDELPPTTTLNEDPNLAFDNNPEGVFPGNHDVAHGQNLYRPESKDIDLYRFTVEATGLFTAETFAERLPDSSFLDTTINLYRRNSDGSRRLIARNDDYFSEDSFVRMQLDAGTYFVGVSASGNNDYDPSIEDSGLGGVTQGPYDLRLNFRPEVTRSIVDATGTAFDGNADGVPGGVYNFWFRAQSPENTIFVDKAAGRGGDGSLASPMNNIARALAAADEGDVVRIVGNGGADGDLSTVGDNLAYEIGFNSLGRPLTDGESMKLPKGVTVMVDEGAVFKLRRQAIEVGSSAPTVDRSQTALQVLGTPENSVFFTSFNDESIGVDGNPLPISAAKGDWGGLIFRNDLDKAEGRFGYEARGIFLDYVNHADMRYGGGSVVIDSVEQIVTPIHLTGSRPTVTFNSIRLSADAAMSASPDSFEETNFHAPQFQSPRFTSDYDRVGPDIDGNRLLENSINGLFVRISTPAGNRIRPLTVAGRWDDTDVVHVVSENLPIRGTPGGPIGEPNFAGADLPIPDQYDKQARTDASLVIDPGITVKLDGAGIRVGMGAQLVAEGVDGRSVIFTSLLDDRYGAGGTFDTSNNQDKDPPDRGDWTGLYVGHAGTGSIDHAVLAYGGGVTKIEGTFAGFNVIEVHQAEARVTNSIIENNLSGSLGQAPEHRFEFGSNAAGAIFIRQAQPIIVNNIIRNTSGPADEVAPAISVGPNALNHRALRDYGRATGSVDLIRQFRDNQGPLIRLNTQVNNKTNGMVVRGQTVTTQSVWDDTDITHVVVDTIYVPDFHTFGGVRLESSPNQSLVVKLAGDDAGFTATGKPLDIDDRIGGSIQIVGQPGHPVVLTALDDNTVGAGFQPDGTALTDTKNEQLPERTEPVGTFRILPQYSTAFAANQDAVDSVQRAISIWHAILQDPIDIVIDLDFGATGGAAALTTSEIVPLGYNTVRQRLIDDAGPHESFVSQLPRFRDFTAVLPEDMLNPYTILGTMDITRANALALGLDPLALPANASAFNPNLNRDGIITIDNALNVAGTDLFDFVVHEIGHLLGFNSVVDAVDAGNRQLALTALDLFRLAPGAGQVDFTNSPRVLDPEFDQVFYDGGLFDPVGIPILDLKQGDIPFSTGTNIGDGFQASHWKDDGSILGIAVGIMDPTDGNVFEETLTMSTADKRAFDLIGWDVVGSGFPGGWRSIRVDKYANDRNVEVIVEQEVGNATAPGTNATPGTAQFVGKLAPAETDGDDNRRLGFEIHGFISQPADVDVYSFEADAGTEVWFDIDRTSSFLDSIVELVDASGQLLARSDNSAAEQIGLRLTDPSRGEVPEGDATGLNKDPFISQDRWTTNVHDAGMRLDLPGAVGTTNTYHVRVRSSSADPSNVSGGLTTGIYQLQVRLGELDEIPGSTVRFADIRYATNGIEVLGQPTHSPLLGEVAETSEPNDTLVDAQEIGNPLVSDRAAVSVAGSLSANVPDVDWYRLEIDWQDLQALYPLASIVFDLDYADGLAGPDAKIFVYDENGVLVLTSTDSNIIDDLPRPQGGSDQADLTRGSFGVKDPYIGSINLPTDIYYVAVSSTITIPDDLGQFILADPTNPFIRLEPIDSVIRIVEDHIEFTGGSTFAPPVVPRFIDQLYGVKIPSGNQIREGESVTVVNTMGDSVTYELDSDGSVAGSNIPVIYFPTVTDPLLGVPTELAIASQLAAAVSANGPRGVIAFAAGDRVLFQEPASPDLNISHVGVSPHSEVTVSRPGIVPWTLSDVTLYVSQDLGLVGTDLSSLVTVDPYHGTLETTVGSFEPNIGDLAMRVEKPLVIQHSPPVLRGELFSYTLGGMMPTDDNTGNYIQIDTATAAVTVIGDDMIETYDIDPNYMLPPVPMPPPDPPIPPVPPPAARAGGMATLGGIGGIGGGGIGGGVGGGGQTGGGGAGVAGAAGIGIPFNAITFLDSMFAPSDVEFGLAVGLREASQFMNPLPAELPLPIIAAADDNQNTLYLFNRTNGTATSSMEGDRDTAQLFNELPDPAVPPNFQTTLDPSMTFPTPATNIRERGVLDTTTGGGPGGQIHGMTTLGGVIYAVTNTGGLFTIAAAPPTFFAATITFVGMVTHENGDPVEFAGLTYGPPNVEGGRYAETLFGIDTDGVLHAFDLQGNPQPIFVDGNASVATGALSPTGLAFSTVDQNLWHVTTQRMEDPGHGLEVPVTRSRQATINGGSSLHFGITSVNDAARRNYNFPGGAHGSLVSNSFSLADYESGDKPVLYFNYLLDTEGTDYDPMTIPPTPMRDSFRVFVSDDGRIDRQGQWYLLATNNSFRSDLALDEYDDVNASDDIVIDVQELYDNVPTWRQARIDLSDFAGSDNLRLRFDFSSAGETSLGSGNGLFANGMEGEELRALPASEVRDGQVVVIDGTAFEFDLGFSLVAPTGDRIPDGEMILVEGANAAQVAFEFDYDGVVADGSTPIPIVATMSAENVADAVTRAISASPLAVLPPDDAMFAEFNVPEPNETLGAAIESRLTRSEPGSFELLGAIGDNPDHLAEPSLDFDLIRVTAAESGTIEITARSDDYLPSISLFDADGNVLDSAVGRPRRATQLDFDVEVTGNYFVGVSSGIHTDYDPVAGTPGTPSGEFGQYNLTIETTSSAVTLVREENRVNLKNVEAIRQSPASADDALGMFVDGSPGATFGTPIKISANMGSLQVASALREAIAQGLANGVVESVKLFNDSVRIAGHVVDDPGPLGVAAELPGDTGAQNLGAFTISGPPLLTLYPGALRSMDNEHEGVYIDDIVIGFAERGEMVTGNENQPNTDYLTDTRGQRLNNDILQGQYQLEVRRGRDVGEPTIDAISGQDIQSLGSSFDTNDQLSESTSMVAMPGSTISSGQTFRLGGEVDSVTFTFVDSTVTEGNDTIATALDSGLSPGTPGTYFGVGAIGDNVVSVGDNNNPLQGLDVDMIAVQLQQGDFVQVDVDAANPDAPNAIRSELDSILRVFDADGNEIVASDNDLADGESPSAGLRDPAVSFRATADGTFYVAVSGFQNVAYDPNVEGSGMLVVPPVPAAGRYEIQIRVNGGAPDPADTVVIPYGDFETSDAVADRIIAKINGPQTRRLGLGVTAVRLGTDNRILLFGDNTNVDVVRLEVTDESNDVLTTATDTGVLVGRSPTFRAMGEIGDNPNLADPSVDVDLFRLEANASHVIRVSIMTAEIGSLLTPALLLFDAAGNTVPALFDPDIPGPSIVFPVTATGTYYVGVSSEANGGYDPMVEGSGAAGGPVGQYELQIQMNDGEIGLQSQAFGDDNVRREQGQLLIQSSIVRDAAEYGIVVDAGQRDGNGTVPHQGPARNLPKTNIDRLAPGVTVVNNIVARGRLGGVHYSGDPNPTDTPLAAVTFGRILNNTIFGTGGEFFPRQLDLLDRLLQPVEIDPEVNDVGILVTENAGPTLLNNIIVNMGTGISVDGTSSTTVVGGTVYQANETNAVTNFSIGLGDFPMLLRRTDTLFVNPVTDNFYLDAGTRAIDSSVDSLDDRPAIVDVKDAVSIPVSPILAPDRDITGQLRVDDPNVDTPSGVGEKVFKDRGALDRADFVGPAATLLNPQDNDSAGTDLDPAPNSVQFFGSFSEFVIGLSDGADPSDTTLVGTGPDDFTVTSDTVTVLRDDDVLTEGDDYRFGYDKTSNIIRITSLSGVWPPDHTYVVSLDNSAIRDIANNRLNPNQESGETTFTVGLGRGVDFGDAPSPYPTLDADSGASHVIVEGFFLGTGVRAESDGRPSSDAMGDVDDEDGLTFVTALVRSVDSVINVFTSSEGRVDAWIDVNADGDWDDSGEQILTSQAVETGSNMFHLKLPGTSTIGTTYARVRFSSAGGLAPTGPANDGEVEDYQVNILVNPWQNPDNPLDVNGMDGPSPLDALLIINELNDAVYRDTEGRLPIPPESPDAPPPYFDVNGDGFIAPLDALLVINRLSNLTPPPFSALTPAGFVAAQPDELAVAGAIDNVAATLPIDNSTHPLELGGTEIVTRMSRGNADADQLAVVEHTRDRGLVEFSHVDHLLNEIGPNLDKVQPADNARDELFANHFWLI